MDILFNAISKNLPQLITAGIGIGVVWSVLSKILKILKEISELFKAVIVAFSDKKLTKDEIQTIIKEANDVKAIAQTLISSRMRRR